MIHIKTNHWTNLLLPIGFVCPVCGEEIRFSKGDQASGRPPRAWCRCMTVDYDGFYLDSVKKASELWGTLITRKQAQQPKSKGIGVGGIAPGAS
jgi:hypothetical protein